MEKLSPLLNNPTQRHRHTKKVLLMYITEVSGHHQATLAIEKSLKIVDPNVSTLNINGFSYTYPIMEKVVNKAYMGIIKKTPKVWDYLYDNPKIAKRLQSIKEIIHKATHTKLAKLFERFQPDVVVCTQAFPCGMVADYKQSFGLNLTVIGVLTDYAPHSYWIHDGVDYYIAPSKETGEGLIQKGAFENKVKALGIPVDSKFTKTLDKEAMAHKLGINLHLPTVLIMGGGQGLGPIQDVVTSLSQSPANLQLIIVAGINKKLIKWLKRVQQKSPKKIIIFEYANNIEELMEVATLIVTKPGGMTTTEALVKGLPMVIVEPIPGQEVYNTNFLLSKNVAICVNRLDKIANDIESLLQTPGRITAMRQAALGNSKPNSSLDIAQLILQTNV